MRGACSSVSMASSTASGWWTTQTGRRGDRRSVPRRSPASPPRGCARARERGPTSPCLSRPAVSCLVPYAFAMNLRRADCVTHPFSLNRERHPPSPRLRLFVAAALAWRIFLACARRATSRAIATASRPNSPALIPPEAHRKAADYTLEKLRFGAGRGGRDRRRRAAAAHAGRRPRDDRRARRAALRRRLCARARHGVRRAARHGAERPALRPLAHLRDRGAPRLQQDHAARLLRWTSRRAPLLVGRARRAAAAPGLLVRARTRARWWWLYTWVAWIAFTLLLVAIFPRWIAPLFNRFTPLEDGRGEEPHRGAARAQRLPRRRASS